jgi:hypothetical protein
LVDQDLEVEDLEEVGAAAVEEVVVVGEDEALFPVNFSTAATKAGASSMRAP